ncbi:hypothetical protein HD806DRAFT_475098 [Xylariaceae sp. AK1471]|nr:hypothetical protein HD806DRAFT_475098 [Xylariaceae sp. AK1471]
MYVYKLSVWIIALLLGSATAAPVLEVNTTLSCRLPCISLWTFNRGIHDDERTRHNTEQNWGSHSLFGLHSLIVILKAGEAGCLPVFR